MTLVRYEPASLVSQLQDEMSRVFTALSAGGASSTWVPPVDITEYADRFELAVDLPGVDPDKVEITLEDGVLSISGERVPDARRADDSAETRMRTERGHGRFYRRFVLPETVDGERVQASGRNGVLAITIPKQAKAQPRRIKVAA
ncbi:MAG TPA: Hsp20/alpha crystallin family protein [Steroidobacteraceae bacterium]|nr:Hsp20/alpha crystallin family protein [Steroidobacteraceae bacterium]